jgi:hypothetical protein
VGGVDRSHGVQHLDLLVAQGVGAVGDRWFHGQERNHLEEVVLLHVTDGAHPVAERASTLHAEGLGGTSRPKGFSTISRAPAASPAPARFSTTTGNNVGGMAR